ncbi:MAG: hypothetical protein IKR40_11110 [Treponema sp.]|nr:hypothetical protein [Treponema sp.]
MKKYKQQACAILIGIIAIIFILFSYYIEQRIGYVLYNWMINGFMCVIIIYSLAMIFCFKKFCIILIQVLLCISIFLMIKLDVPDRFALCIEVPKYELRINNGEEFDKIIEENDDFIVVEWEPGFLDYQYVLVYDKRNILENTDSKIYISEGKLYRLYKAKNKFFLCLLYR